MSNILEVYGLNKVLPTSAASLYKGELANVPLAKIASDEIIGIEIEVEATAVNNKYELHKVWQVTTDGSLRNNGHEFVSKPIKASDAPIALAHLLTQYLQQDCCFSPRTSVHIHLNVQDLTTTEVVDFVALYSLFEKSLFQFAGRGRIKNIYCVPLVETSLLTNLASKNDLTRGWSKYTSLNLLPMREQGTVEFRHMHGTFDTTKLCNWIGMITSLKGYVTNTPTKEIRQMLYKMEESVSLAQLKTDIFQDFAGLLMDNNDSINIAKSVITDNKVFTQVVTSSIRNSNFTNFKE